MCKKALREYNYLPEEMRAYLRNYGCSFSKRACEFAVGLMKKKNRTTGKLEPIEAYDKEKVEELLKKYGVTLERNVGWNHVYVANMVLADRWKSSVEDEVHFVKAIKDEIDDEDTSPDSIFTCWLTKMEDNGIPIPWDEMI